MFSGYRLDKEMKQLQRRKLSLIELYSERKRGSDTSQGSSGLGPSKKSSVCSMDSPPLQKKVVRLQEYEEVEIQPVKGKGSLQDSTRCHTHNMSHDKIIEMERRVKEELEAGLSTGLATFRQPKRGEERGLSPSQTWSKGSTSPQHSSASDRHSPVIGKCGSGISTSEVRPVGPSHHATAAGTPATFGHHYPPSSPPTNSARPGRSGFHDNGRRNVSHSDSSEWTEFACASTSGGSVEVGGQLSSSVYSSSNHLSSAGAISMSEFDPIRTIDSSKPSREN